MQRMNLGEVPDDVDAVLVAATEGCRQSLSAFVVDRLIEVAQAVCVPDWVATYPAPRGTGVTADDVVAAVGAVCEASWARLSAPCCGERALKQQRRLSPRRVKRRQRPPPRSRRPATEGR
jgi:hypothetical protein